MNNGIKTLPVFADLFENKNSRSKDNNFRLKKIMSSEVFPCISNHSLTASQSIIDCLKYKKTLVVPWDWNQIEPIDKPKLRPFSTGKIAAFYAGRLIEDKGVGDCLKALSILKDMGVDIRIAFAGSGNIELWIKKAQNFNIG
jgi:glycosyltransferase involved in cell wall biosynthesis